MYSYYALFHDSAIWNSAKWHDTGLQTRMHKATYLVTYQGAKHLAGETSKGQTDKGAKRP